VCLELKFILQILLPQTFSWGVNFACQNCCNPTQGILGSTRVRELSYQTVRTENVCVLVIEKWIALEMWRTLQEYRKFLVEFDVIRSGILVGPQLPWREKNIWIDGEKTLDQAFHPSRGGRSTRRIDTAPPKEFKVDKKNLDGKWVFNFTYLEILIHEAKTRLCSWTPLRWAFKCR
jgi:hypothetical protein